MFTSEFIPENLIHRVQRTPGLTIVRSAPVVGGYYVTTYAAPPSTLPRHRKG